MENKQKIDIERNQEEIPSNISQEKLEIEKDEDEKYVVKVEAALDYSELQFDKQIVYLAGGGLAFTVAFVKNIIVFNDSTVITFLVITWSLLALSLITNLLSHKTSIYAMKTELDGNTPISDIWDNITEILNITSIISLLIGIVSFIIFISSNL